MPFLVLFESMTPLFGTLENEVKVLAN